MLIGLSLYISELSVDFSGFGCLGLGGFARVDFFGFETLGLGGFGSVDGLGCIKFGGFYMFVFFTFVILDQGLCFCFGKVDFEVFLGAGFCFIFLTWVNVGFSGSSVLCVLNFFKSMSKFMGCGGFVQVDFVLLLDSFLSMGIVLFTDDRTVKFPHPLFTSITRDDITSCI